MTRRTALTLLLISFWASQAAGQPKPVPVPEAIKVPDGHKLVESYQAEGVQVYEAVVGKGGQLEWKFEGPLAKLFDAERKKAGIHYYGPAWEATDGSKVVKVDDRKLQLADAPKPDSDLPWLLVPVKADDLKDAKTGIFSKIVYVQRVATSGGRPPKERPKRADGKIAVHYKAVYYFWARSEAKALPRSE